MLLINMENEGGSREKNESKHPALSIERARKRAIGAALKRKNGKGERERVSE